MVVVIPMEIIAVLKAMKNEFSDTFTWRQINITSNRNGMLSAGLTFLWQEQDFFFWKDHNCSESYCIFQGQVSEKKHDH